MNILKQIINYLIWTVLALLLGIGYMRIVLGPRSANSSGLWVLFDVIYNFALYHVGLIIGSIIALLFILVDVFYLKKKRNTSSKKMLFRFLAFIIIALVVVTTHYIFEKVIDII